MTAPEPPTDATSRMTRDPVRIVWVCYGFVQALLIALMAAEIVTTTASAVITGIALACYVAVSELFVRPETVPRAELSPAERLAHPRPHHDDER